MLPLLLTIGKLVLTLAGSVLVQKLLGPRPDHAQAKGLSDFSLPTADASRAIPIIFGSVKLTGPNVIWYGNLGAEPFKINGQDAGYYYTLGLDLAVCMGPVDSVDEVLFDDKHPSWADVGGTTDYRNCTFNNTTLFGGNKSGGGVKGNATVYLGTPDQPIDAYMQTQCNPDYPGLARVCHIVFHGGYKSQYGGVYLGTSEALRPIAVRATRCPNTLGLPSGHHRMLVDGGYDANPACMLYEILTDTTWGLGIPSSAIDVAAFQAVGQTLYAESFGLAMILEQGAPAADAIRDILRHIDGGLSTDPTTGKLTLKLIRADYTIGSLPVLDESCLDQIEFSRGSWSQTFNTVKVVFTSRADNYTSRTAQWQNLANQQAQGGVVATQLEYRGLSNAAAAGAVAARGIKVGSYPLGQLKAKANRVAWALRQCDPFVLNLPSYGITGLVCRITKPAGGELENGRLSIEAIEDAFAIGSSAYGLPPGSGWVDPLGVVNPCAQQALLESPYQLAGGPWRELQVLAARAESSDIGFTIQSDPAGGTAFTETNDIKGWCPYGTLVASYAANASALDATGFSVTNLVDVDALVSCNSTELYYGINLALIDSEIIGWQTISSSGATRTVTNVLRGLLDTVPAAHSAGAKVWFLTAGPRGLVNPSGGYATDLTASVKALPYNLRTALPIASATAMSATLTSRVLKPLPPGNVQVGGAAWPTTLAHGGAGINVSWNIRHRIDQAAAGVVVAQDAASFSASAEGNYTVEVRVGGTLKRTVTGLSGLLAWTWDATMQTADGGIAGAVVAIRIIPVNGSLVGTYQERTFTLT